MNSLSPDQEYLKSLTLLYVEDENNTRKMGSEFLSRLVGMLITAKNGAEGLNAYREHNPDIVITDIQMPIMDGLTMIQKIRDLDNNRLVPVLVMSAFEQIDYLKRSIPLGAFDYVVKPLEPRLTHKSTESHVLAFYPAHIKYFVAKIPVDRTDPFC